MKALRAWLAILLLAVLGGTQASCGGGGGGLAADGGVSGTGLSAITGNVSEITTGSDDLAGIRVTIAGTTFTTVTDAAGAFSLTGAFEGPVTLVFERDDGVRAETMVEVPSDGSVTLEDVTLDPVAEEATPARRTTAFPGTIARVDCGAGLLVVRTRGDEAREVTVHLDGAFIHDGDGAAIDCAVLRTGDRVRVQGVLLDDGTVVEADVELLPPPATPTPVATRTPDPTTTPAGGPTATREPGATATREQPEPTETPRRSDAPGRTPRPPDVPPSPTATASARDRATRTPAPLVPRAR
jgi:hypothetical protein